MDESKYFQDQRKYYFIFFKDEDNYVKEYVKKKSFSYDEGNGYVHKFAYRKNEQLHFGDTSKYNNENYFDYGCFLIENVKLGIAIIIAPFSQIIDELFLKSKDFSANHCLKVDLYSLMDEIFIKDLLKDRIKLTITGIEIARSGTSKLSNIMIKGTHPLDHEIGQVVYDLIQENKEKSTWFPLNCKLGIIFSADNPNRKRLDISLTTDKFGLSSFYMRSNYTSTVFVNYFVEFLINNKFIVNG